MEGRRDRRSDIRSIMIKDKMRGQNERVMREERRAKVKREKNRGRNDHREGVK